MDHLFRLEMSPWELILRGTIMYWFLFLLFRFVLSRDAGSMGLADVLLVVVVADASQNAMAGEYKTVSEGVLLVATIGAWNYFIDWMSYRYKWFSRFADRRAVPLIRHGTILRANLRREMLTEEELQSQLRQNGLEKASKVKHAMLEPDGSISVIPY
ncbi:MAG: YetF domain-containing protein [Acidobacteriota bacterium]